MKNYAKYMQRCLFYAQICFLLLMGACSSLPYQDDLAFAVSAQANSPEFPIYVNGSICKDMDGNVGMCSKRIKSIDSITIHFDAQAYPYNLTIACTSPIAIPGATVPAGQPFDLVIAPKQMNGLVTFICRGEVYPDDRPQPLSGSFEVRVNVVDAAYVPREQMSVVTIKGHPVLVLGEYARDAWVCDSGACKRYSKATEVELHNPASVSAYSLSYNMRANFYRWETPAAAVN